MPSRKLSVEIIGDSRSLERAFGRASRSGSGFGSALGKLGKVAAVGVGAAFAGLAATLKVGFDELSEGQRVSAQTAAALASTGGAAKITAKEIAGLAGSLSRMSGVDDEAIQAGENLLLSFTNIRNEVGKGNDIFNQATSSILDMSVALGQDMKSSAIQLGKALNDPIKGVTALQRVGVSFTAAQKEQIKSLVEHGKTLDAQKLILAELTKEFGGSARAAGETLPGQLSKLKNSFSEVAGGIAQTLLPFLMQFLDWTNRNMPTIQRVIQVALDAVVATIKFLAPIISRLIEWFSALAGAAREHWPKVQHAAEVVVNWYRTNLQPAIQNVLKAIEAIWERFGGTITRVVRTAFGVLATLIGAVLGNIGSIISAFLAILRGDWSTAWNELKEIPGRTLRAALTLIQGLVSIFFTTVKALGKALLDGILAGLAGLKDALINLLKGAIGGAIDAVKGFFGIGSPSRVTAEQIGKPLGEGVLQGFITGTAQLPEKMRDKVREAIEAARSAIESARGGVAQAMDALVQAALAAFDRLSSELETRSEKKLRLMDERAAARARKEELTAARGELAAARAAFAGVQPAEGEDPQEFANRLGAATRAIVDAQKRVDDALAAQKRAHLEAEAEKERKALEDRRALQRRHLEEQLAAAASAFERGAISLQQHNQRVLAILDRFGIPMKDAALKLGGALAEGLREAFAGVQTAARALAQEIITQLSNIRVVVQVELSSKGPPIRRRQHGGPVRAGMPFLVGEAGPELFVPQRSGRIVPGGMALAGVGGGGVTINNFSFPNYVGSRSELEQAMQDVVGRWQRRNGGSFFG